MTKDIKRKLTKIPAISVKEQHVKLGNHKYTLSWGGEKKVLQGICHLVVFCVLQCVKLLLEMSVLKEHFLVVSPGVKYAQIVFS